MLDLPLPGLMNVAISRGTTRNPVRESGTGKIRGRKYPVLSWNGGLRREGATPLPAPPPREDSRSSGWFPSYGSLGAKTDRVVPTWRGRSSRAHTSRKNSTIIPPSVYIEHSRGAGPPYEPALRISRSRSSFRRILPEMVFGSFSTNSTTRGYL